VDGNIWTSSGVSAGIDVMLAWVSYMYGYATAKELADGAEYEWHQDPDWVSSLLCSLPRSASHFVWHNL